MGIVIKQSSISAVFTYLGAVIGFINVLWLFPAYLSTEQIGLLRVLPSAALLMLPIAQLGVPQSLIKFYPEFKNQKNGIPQLLGLLLIGLVIGLLIFGVIIFIFYEPINNYFTVKSALLNDYFHIIIFLVIIFTIQLLFEVYTRPLFKIVVPNFIKEVLIRVLTSLAVTLYLLDYITFSQLANGLVIIYSIALIVLLLYLKYLGALNISFQFTLINKDVFSRMLNFCLYAVLGSSGAYIMLQIDQVMITSMLGLSENGIYTTVFFIAVVIELVRRPISQIVQPLISDSFKNNDLEAVQKIYKQVSINQMIIGSLLFIGIICNLDSLFLIMPQSEAFEKGRWVIIIIGIGKMTDMTFSTNSEIIVLSKYYKYNVMTVLFLALVTVSSNYILIPIYGINGAAFATLLSVVLYNLLKMFFIKIKIGISPFTFRNITMLGIIVITFLTGYYIPRLDFVLLDMLYRSIVITAVFGLLVYHLAISKEVNDIVSKFLLRIKDMMGN